MAGHSAPPLIEPLLGQLSGTFSHAELGKVRSAYDVAARWHDGQLRKSGEPYITHPVAVAALAADAGLGCPMVCAALLHDVLADTGCDPAFLRATFGDEIVSLVEGLDEYDRTSAQPADDRIVVLKLLDRLHNMRTIQYLDADKQLLRSRETLDLLVPHAQRLGLDPIASELGELARHRLRALTSASGGTEISWRILCLGAFLLPLATRPRYLEEWSAELRTLRGRRCRARFAWQLLRGLPRLSLTLHSSTWHERRLPAGLRAAAARITGTSLESLRWLVRSKARPWILLAPAIAWMVLRTARSNLGDAMATLITVPPVLSAGIQWLRDRLGLNAPNPEDPR